MDSLPRAVSFARGLLALSRSKQTGVLWVTSELGECRIAITDGVPRALHGLPSSEQVLGDALAAQGAFDARAHHEAWLGRAGDAQPVGAWLVERGLVRRSAVEAALRKQLRTRISCLLDARGLDYRFDPGPAEVGSPFVSEPIAPADLVLGAMRTRMLRWPGAQLAEAVGASEVQLTALGRDLLRAAALWPEEAVAHALLKRGTTLTQVLDATACSPRALRFLALLSLLAAIKSRPTRERTFSLLVRKREQLGRNADPRTLLDLPGSDATRDTRRALRRLARNLHPDALGPNAPEALRRASGEVLSALVDAERALRTDDSSL